VMCVRCVGLRITVSSSTQPDATYNHTPQGKSRFTLYFWSPPTISLYCWRTYLFFLSITVHNMPPNTDHAHNKHIWNIICNFNQVQVITPWWWILCDPKHVRVIFNMCLLDFYITRFYCLWLLHLSALVV
jgi:hypothetical protein